MNCLYLSKTNIMRKNLPVLIFLAFLTFSFVGKKAWDDRLLSKYSEQELMEMEKNNPEQLNYLNKVARYGWNIMDLPEEKANAHEIRGTVTIKDMKKVNLFELGFMPEPKNYQYYKINNTKKMLVVLSEEMIRKH